MQYMDGNNSLGQNMFSLSIKNHSNHMFSPKGSVTIKWL